MKNLILLLLFTSLIFSNAQDQRLFDTEWSLYDLVIDDISYPPPSSHEFPIASINFDVPSSVLFNFNVCGGDSCSAEGNFSDDTEFEVTGIVCLASGCNSQDNRSYSYKYAAPFSVCGYKK